MKMTMKASFLVFGMLFTSRVMACEINLPEKEFNEVKNEAFKLELLESFVKKELKEKDTLVAGGQITILDKKHGIIAKGENDNLVIQRLRPVADFLFEKGDDRFYMIVNK